MRYIAYLLYAYYSKGSKSDAPYFYAISTLTFFVFIHLFILALITGFSTELGIFFSASRGWRYLMLFGFGTPIFLILYYGIKKSEIIKLKNSFSYEHFDKEFNHRQFLWIYMIMVFAALVIIALWKNGNI